MALLLQGNRGRPPLEGGAPPGSCIAVLHVRYRSSNGWEVPTGRNIWEAGENTHLQRDRVKIVPCNKRRKEWRRESNQNEAQVRARFGESGVEDVNMLERRTEACRRGCASNTAVLPKPEPPLEM